jgi:hypothetical protein
VARFLARRRDTKNTTSDRNSRSLYYSLIILCRLTLIHVLFLGCPFLHEPSDHLARGVPLKYFRFRLAACRLHLPNLGVVIQLSAVRLLTASACLASSGSFFSRPSTCPALSFLLVFALMFPVRPKSYISALTVYPSYRYLLVWPCPFSP